MKVLVFVSGVRRPNNTGQYSSLSNYCDVEVRTLSKKEQSRFDLIARDIDFSHYDVVLIDLLFRKILKFWWVFSEIPNLFFFEEDLCQNFIEESRWCGEFVEFYRRIPKFCLLSSGHSIVSRMKSIGIDARVFPKGYDDKVIFFGEGVRPVQYGFIGALGSPVYRARRHILKELTSSIGLELMSAEPGPKYAAALSSIDVFISCDAELNEYMIKNFEALGAGCILCAYRQSDEIPLGFIDMVNMVSYGDESELKEKLIYLEDNPKYKEVLRQKGTELAERRYSYSELGGVLYSQLSRAAERNKMLHLTRRDRLIKAYHRITEG